MNQGFASINGPDCGDDRFVLGAYQTILGRTPSANEVAWWASQLAGGLTRAQLRDAFLDSDEFRSVNGQVEYLLDKALREAGRKKEKAGSTKKSS